MQNWIIECNGRENLSIWISRWISRREIWSRDPLRRTMMTMKIVLDANAISLSGCELVSHASSPPNVDNGNCSPTLSIFSRPVCVTSTRQQSSLKKARVICNSYYLFRGISASSVMIFIISLKRYFHFIHCIWFFLDY